MGYLHFILGFFVPIAVAGGAGYLLGRFHERLKWNVLIGKGVIPPPISQEEKVEFQSAIRQFSTSAELSKPPKVGIEFLEAKIILLVHNLHQVKLCDKNGFQYTIKYQVEGVHWKELREGDLLRCKIRGNQVIGVKLITPWSSA